MPRRFDGVLMAPPALQPRVDAACLQVVRAWCEAGAFTHPRRAFEAAAFAPAPAGAAALDGVACELDGSHALARMGRWRGLAWRALILLREHLPWHAPRAADPWDCGWWRAGALSAAAAFRPRRATLLLVREADADAAAALLSALRANSPHYRHPLRVLVLGARPMPELTSLDTGPRGGCAFG